MRSSKRQSGFSRIEVICISGLAVVALAVLLGIGYSAWHDWHEGNDSATLNTAQSCANIGLTDACLVPGCSGKGAEHKFHIDEHGRNFAYFDKVGNCLVGTLPTGYNENEVSSSDGRRFAPGTAVVVATREGASAAVDWTLGR